jgi:signal transduction histidine kinase
VAGGGNGGSSAELQAELERRLAEVDNLRRRVLNVIPHALRTPVTTFRGLAEAIQHATPEQIHDEIAPALRRLAAQAEHLLDDMLIAAGLTTALPTGSPTSTPVIATAQQVWSELSATPLVVEGDEAELVAVPGAVFKMLVHLLDNAAKYGEGPTTLRVTPAGEGRTVVEIESGGKPLGGDDRAELLFEPFYRGEAAVTRGAAGLGVGLPVARALAEQAGGTLTVRAGSNDDGFVAVLELPST